MINKNERRYCVYMLRFSATGEPFYIGKGLCNRPSQHYCQCNRSKKGPKNVIINNFDTYYTIEREGLTNYEANAYEKELIAIWGFENLTNLTRGGSGTDGRIASKETRAKMSGENNPMFGKSHSEEAKAKLREAMIGKSGKNSHNYDTTVHTFRHKDGRLETCTQYELRIKYSLNKGNLSSVVNGKRRNTGGYYLYNMNL